MQLPGAGGVIGTQRDSVCTVLRFGFAGNSVQARVSHNVCASQKENCSLSLETEVKSAGLLSVTFTTT